MQGRRRLGCLFFGAESRGPRSLVERKHSDWGLTDEHARNSQLEHQRHLCEDGTFLWSEVIDWSTESLMEPSVPSTDYRRLNCLLDGLGRRSIGDSESRPGGLEVNRIAP